MKKYSFPAQIKRTAEITEKCCNAFETKDRDALKEYITLKLQNELYAIEPKQNITIKQNSQENIKQTLCLNNIYATNSYVDIKTILALFNVTDDDFWTTMMKLGIVELCNKNYKITFKGLNFIKPAYINGKYYALIIPSQFLDFYNQYFKK